MLFKNAAPEVPPVPKSRRFFAEIDKGALKSVVRASPTRSFPIHFNFESVLSLRFWSLLHFKCHRMEMKPEAAPTLQSIPLIFFRKIFILQLAGLVLTYNFTDCDFEKIRKKYQEVIYQALDKYMNGTKSTGFNHYIYCEDPPDCLTKINRFTFYPNHGCPSLAAEVFAVRTNAALTLRCPGYSGMQMNNTQAKKKRKKREATTNKCREQVSRLIELWRRFSRIS